MAFAKIAKGMAAAWLSAALLCSPAPPAVHTAAPPLAQRTLLVDNILQVPELPNGCEGTALAIVLNYYGFEADKTDVCLNFITCQPFTYSGGQRYGGDPEQVYPGDPTTTQGFYCYPPVIVAAADRYLAQNGSALRAQDISGATEQDLVGRLSAGAPVIVWKTIDGAAPWRMGGFSWVLTDTGEGFAPLGNVHVMVLRGYDDENFYLSDPLGRTAQMARAAFMENFESMGSRAVVLQSLL